MGALSPTHKPDYSKTEPPVSIPPQPAWFVPDQIVSLDPWGHLVPQAFRREIEEIGLDVRPSIAVTKARMKLSEIDDSARQGSITVDGKIVLRSQPLVNSDGSPNPAHPGVDINVSKAAVEPVWFIPGVAKRFGMYASFFDLSDKIHLTVLLRSESLLRRALFEDTGGMYPELITRQDMKVFLPPIGNLTVYICKQNTPLSTARPDITYHLPQVGPASYLSDESKELTLRVHDECT
jgi:hypothetical protein